MAIAFAMGGFIVLGGIYTILLTPILMKLGVQEKVFPRAAKVAAIGASTQIAPSLLFALGTGINTVNFATIPGFLIAVYAVSRFLRKAMIIKLWTSIGISMAVILGGTISLAVMMFLLF